MESIQGGFADPLHPLAKKCLFGMILTRDSFYSFLCVGGRVPID